MMEVEMVENFRCEDDSWSLNGVRMTGKLRKQQQSPTAMPLIIYLTNSICFVFDGCCETLATDIL
jgi:hypothetical protein